MKLPAILTLALALVAAATAATAASSIPRAAEPAASARPRAERAVLFYFDGLHPEAIDRLDLPNLKALRAAGVNVREALMPYPWHPSTTAYGRLHSTSLPNVVTMAGNLFLREPTGASRQPMLQDLFDRRQLTAVAVGSKAYDTITPGFSLVEMADIDDARLMDGILATLARHDPVFWRIQLQDTGRAGMKIIDGGKRAPLPAIWDKDGPYAAAAREGDRQLGRFVARLREQGRWDSTLFVFMADGQGLHGWHLPSDRESWRTPLIFVGPGVRRGAEIAYAEVTDVVPTIAAALGLPAPNPGPGAGRVLAEIFEPAAAPAAVASSSQGSTRTPRRLERLNEQIREHLLLRARLQILADQVPEADNALLSSVNAFRARQFYQGDPFYGIDRVMEWHLAGGVDELLAKNEAALAYLRTELARAERLARERGVEPRSSPPAGSG